jgi:hypothetical protein
MRCDKENILSRAGSPLVRVMSPGKLAPYAYMALGSCS